MARLFNAVAALILALAPFLSAPLGASMRVDPMIIDLTPTPNGSTATVQITNVTDIDLPVEMTVMKRTVVDGHEKLVPADNDFVIFPPQFLLKPSETQTVRLQWIAGEKLTQSTSYYVYATQVPVPLKPGESGVVVSYRFGISVQVVPNRVEPKLVVVSIDPETNDKGVAGFKLTLRNEGTRYARLAENSLDLTSAAGVQHWDPEKLKKATGVGFMLPGETRSFFIPFDGTLGPNPSVKLQPIETKE